MLKTQQFNKAKQEIYLEKLKRISDYLKNNTVDCDYYLDSSQIELKFNESLTTLNSIYKVLMCLDIYSGAKEV